MRKKPSWKQKKLSQAVALACLSLVSIPISAGSGSCPASGANTISGAVTTTCFLDNGDSVTITSTGSIDDSVGVEVDGNTVGAITNQGLIKSSDEGIYIFDDAIVNGDITNSGTIESFGEGLYLYGTVLGDITNSGVIDVVSEGLYIFDSSITGDIVNSGTITGDGDNTGALWFSELNVGGSIINSGLIEEFGEGLYLYGSSIGGDIINSGVIDIHGEGFYIFSNSTIAGDVINSGTITTDGGTDGIYIEDSDINGSFINSGTINGTPDLRGVYLYGGTIGGDVINSGEINVNTSATHGMYIFSMTVLGSIVNSGTLGGSDDGLYIYGSTVLGDVTNSGTIIGDGDNGDEGIWIETATIAGSVINTGVIENFAEGMYIFSTNIAGDVINSGVIDGLSEGFYIFAGSIGGDVINSGTINTQTGGDGIYISENDIAGSFINSGTIKGDLSDRGVYIFDSNIGGDVINSGVINPDDNPSTFGLYIYSLTVAGSIINSGTIRADTAISLGGSNGNTIDNTGLLDGGVDLDDGTLNLNGTTGRITGIVDGAAGSTVNVNGTFTPEADFTGITDFNVNSGGTLILSNPVALTATTLTNSGILDASTLDTTLTGDFVMRAGATLRVTVNSDTADDSGSLIVTGDASIDPGSEVFLNTGLIDISDGQTYTVLDAATGDAANLGAGLLPTIIGTAVFDFVASTDGTNIIVTISPSTVFISLLANSPNATSLLNSGALVPLFAADGELNTELGLISDPAEYIAALDSLITDSSGAVLFTSLTLHNLAIDTVLNRVDELRGLASNDGRLSGLAAGDAYGIGNVATWVQGFGNTIDQDNQTGFKGYDASSKGVAFGADTLINNNLRVGAAFTYANANIDTNDVNNNLDIDSYQGSLYSSYRYGEWFLDGVVSYASNDYKSRRSISVNAISRTATGDFDGDQVGVRGRLGRTWAYQGVNVSPYVILSYINIDIDGYTETGAGTANLTVADQDLDVLQSTLGVSVSKQYKNKSSTFVPSVHVAWLHEYLDEEQANTSTFATGGPSFSTRGLDPSDNSLNVGASVDVYNKGSLDVRISYDYEVRDDYDSHAGQLTFRYSFY